MLTKVQMAFYGIWAVVGIVLLLLVTIAALGPNSWDENLNLSSTGAGSQEVAPAPTPQQPPQPTEEQLGCVSDELGQERFDELQTGAVPDEEETVAIQGCLSE